MNLTSVSKDEVTQPPERSSLIERRARRIVRHRHVVLGLALTFVGLAFVAAIVMRIVDPDNFPSLGLAIWWALQTVTTVGYGDVVPTTTVGRVIGGAEMVLGISFIAFLTAGVTSTVIQRGSAEAQAASMRTMSATPRQFSPRWSRHDMRSPSSTRVLTASSRRSRPSGS